MSASRSGSLVIVDLSLAARTVVLCSAARELLSSAHEHDIGSEGGAGKGGGKEGGRLNTKGTLYLFFIWVLRGSSCHEYNQRVGCGFSSQGGSTSCSKHLSQPYLPKRFLSSKSKDDQDHTSHASGTTAPS